MSIFRVAANANEMNVYEGTPLGSSVMPVAPYFQSSMVITRADNILAINDFEENEVWLMVHVSRQSSVGSSGGRYGVALYDSNLSTTLPLVGITKPTGTGDLWTVRRKSGSSMVDMGTIQLANNTLYRLDIHFKAHASEGRIAVYVDGDLALEFVGDTDDTAVANLAEFRRLAQTTTNTNANTCYSAIALSTTDTRTVELVECRPSGAGVFDEWTGGVSDVVPSNDPITTFIEAVAANRRESFTYGSVANLEGMELRGVMLSAVQRENIPEYAPTALFFRTSEGDIRDADPVSTGSEFTPVQRFLPDNGGQPWTYEAVATGQVGVLSVDKDQI